MDQTILHTMQSELSACVLLRVYTSTRIVMYVCTYVREYMSTLVHVHKCMCMYIMQTALYVRAFKGMRVSART